MAKFCAKMFVYDTYFFVGGLDLRIAVPSKFKSHVDGNFGSGCNFLSQLEKLEIIEIRKWRNLKLKQKYNLQIRLFTSKFAGDNKEAN